jgi:clan AA aspartic protease
MIRGSVQSNGDAVIDVQMRGSTAGSARVSTVVDTGFNDWLALPDHAIRSLGLAFREAARYTLADGSEVESRLFVAEIDWLGQWRRILVLEMDVGRSLAWPCCQGANSKSM